MAGGRHSADNDGFFSEWMKKRDEEKDFFDDTRETKKSNDLDMDEFRAFKEKMKNIDENGNEKEFEPNFSDDEEEHIIDHSRQRNYYAEEDDDEDDYEEDDNVLRGLNKATTAVKILIAITALVVIIGGIFVVRKIFSPKPEKEVTEEPAAVVTPAMENVIEGYKVLGKIKISKIDVEQYILDSTDEKALKNGVGKLNGGTLNSIGNFVIVGHNYDKIFKRLPELKVDDEFIIVDKKMNETTYKIKDISRVDPDDLTPLLTTIGKTEVTLITCEDGATKRLIVKAEKVKTEAPKTEGQGV